ncbi:hypothetical protein HON71_04145 [Candidatus Woesearchaeota archaeon]|jgi:hypothetical protein|nr:hypothetical protein [Candidatus Woesearchaeota archaeon]MBT5342539.1 hypothetical protein [Candidatus Woesearchaeota archaeon]
MLKFIKNIKKIFSGKEPEQIEIFLERLDDWFDKKVSELDYNDYFQEYFKQINEIKERLTKKIIGLQEAEINEKEHKGVDDRVRNIVKGHRDNYSREIERFIENLTVIQKEFFSTLNDYQTILNFNQNLDETIDELAKRTAKSYQASQHLFFKEVEEVFKPMGELNLLIKNFNKKEFDKKLNELSEIGQKIKQFNEDKKKKENFEEEIKEKETPLKNKRNETDNKEKELEQLKKSSEYKVFLELKTKKENKEKEIKENGNVAFSFFSKLNKPLRKYERAALDDKLIKKYLENSTKAFFNDEEMEIKEVLQGLKRNLDSLNFEEKQKNNFLELIAKSETNFLDELFSTNKKLEEEKNTLINEINRNEITEKIENKKKEVNSSKNSIEKIEKELEDLKNKLGKIDLEKLKKEIKEKIQNLFFVEVTFSSS